MKKIATEQKLEARFLKIRVQDWQRGRSLKMELYGCDKGGISILSIKKILVKDVVENSSRAQVLGSCSSSTESVYYVAFTGY